MRRFNPLAESSDSKKAAKKKVKPPRKRAPAIKKTGIKRKSPAPPSAPVTKKARTPTLYDHLDLETSTKLRFEKKISAENLASQVWNNKDFCRELVCRIFSKNPELLQEWLDLERPEQLTVRYNYADVELSEEEKSDDGDLQVVELVKPKPRKPRKPAKREKLKPELPYREDFTKKWLKNPLFDERDTYGKMSGHMLGRQLPARFMKVASYVAPMRDAGTPVNIENILERTILMKKASFYEYRWLLYVWVTVPKKFFELINNAENPMELKRGSGLKKVEKTILEITKNQRRKKQKIEPLFNKVFPDFKQSKLFIVK